MKVEEESHECHISIPQWMEYCTKFPFLFNIIILSLLPQSFFFFNFCLFIYLNVHLCEPIHNIIDKVTLLLTNIFTNNLFVLAVVHFIFYYLFFCWNSLVGGSSAAQQVWPSHCCYYCYFSYKTVLHLTCRNTHLSGRAHSVFKEDIPICTNCTVVILFSHISLTS